MSEPVHVRFVDPETLRRDDDYPAGPNDPRPRWKANRRRNRALGVDRFGKPLPRIAGTNPRALGTNPRALRAAVEGVRVDAP